MAVRLWRSEPHIVRHGQVSDPKLTLVGKHSDNTVELSPNPCGQIEDVILRNGLPLQNSGALAVSGSRFFRSCLEP